jgi:hypothetical protein
MRLIILLAPFVLGVNLALQTGAPRMPAGDQWLTKPVDDRTFNTYLDFFTYDRQLPLDLKVAKVDEDQGLRRERLSFQSTPGVRVTAILLQGLVAAGTKPPGLILLHAGGAEGKMQQEWSSLQDCSAALAGASCRWIFSISASAARSC